MEVRDEYLGTKDGSLTVFSLAGMIKKVGLLPACNIQQVPFAYKMYTKTDDEGWEMSNAFKEAFSIDVHIDFIGVWYDVGLLSMAGDVLIHY